MALTPTADCPATFSDRRVTLLAGPSPAGTYIHTCNKTGTVSALATTGFSRGSEAASTQGG